MLKVNNDYSFNWNLLNNLYKKLRNKRRSEIEEYEYIVLKSLIENKKFSSTVRDRTNWTFSEAITTDNYMLNEYISYLETIRQYYEQEIDEAKKEPLKDIYLTENYIFESIHDFIKMLDPEWFKLFMNIYKTKKDYISFSYNRSSSIYLPNSKIWLANINYRGTIADALDAVHEFGHGIEDQINTFDTFNPHRLIIIELFPIVISMIYLLTLKDKKYHKEADKCLYNYNSVMLDSAEEIIIKYNIMKTFPNVKDINELKQLILSTWNQDIDIIELAKIYNNDVEEAIGYVYPFIIAVELVNLYFDDKDSFIYKMKKILSSQDNSNDLAKKLNIKKSTN